MREVKSVISASLVEPVLVSCPVGVALGVLAVLLMVFLHLWELDLERSLVALAKLLVTGRDMVNRVNCLERIIPSLPLFWLLVTTSIFQIPELCLFLHLVNLSHLVFSTLTLLCYWLQFLTYSFLPSLCSGC